MSCPMSDGKFGDHCAVLIKHTFIDIQCLDEENTHVLRRQKSDPLFAYVGANAHPAFAPKCTEPLTPTTCVTPTTCDDCLTPASLNDDNLTPTTYEDSSMNDDDCDDEEEINGHMKTFSFANAVNFDCADEATVPEHGSDTSVTNAWNLEDALNAHTSPPVLQAA